MSIDPEPLANNDDISRAAHKIDELGFTVTDEILMRTEYTRPSVIFGEAENDPPR